jgi:hypothetical protein
MRYFSYCEYDPESPLADDTGGYTVTLSEQDVRKQYWPYWYGRMCEKFGKDHVDEKYNFEDCLSDWQVVNWAWPVDECPYSSWKSNKDL